MKIAIDVGPLNSAHKNRGVGVYTVNLLNEFKKNPELQIQEFNHPSEVKNADIIHYPYFDLFKRSLILHRKIPTVVTVHDVIPLAYPKAYPAGIRGSINYFWQKRVLKKAAAVITDSRSSKHDIVKYLGISQEKIFVVALAPFNYFHKIENKSELEKVRNKFNLPKKFALFVGNVNWNKNLLNMTEAVIKANMDVVFIGKSFEEKNNLNHPELNSFKSFLNKYSGNPQVHILGFVDSENLVAIVNSAFVLLLPSFAEGFGLPILEAQVCGVPVITSNISSMPEVAGSGALMVDPYSVENISQAINKINKNQEIRQSLVNDGFENVRKFSWKKTAEETIKVYQKSVELFQNE